MTKIKEKKSKKSGMLKLEHVVLALILVFYLINNIYYLYNDKQPVIWDDARHLTNSIYYHDAVFHGSNMDFARMDYGPFVYIMSLPFIVIFGMSKISIMMVSFLFLLIYLYSVFSIGKKVIGREGGIICMAIAAFLPITFGLSKIFLLDYPLVAMVALAIAVLLHTRFDNLRSVVFFSAVCIFGILTKINFIVFLIMPILVSIIFQLKEQGFNFKKGIFGVILFIFMMGTIALPWYYITWDVDNSNIYAFVDKVDKSISTEDQIKDTKEYFRANFYENLIVHIAGLSGSQTNILIFVIFVIGLLFLDYRKKESWILLSWLVCPLFFFITFMIRDWHIDTRYMTPAVAAIVVVAVQFIMRFKYKYWIISLVGVVIAYQFLYVSYDIDMFHAYEQEERINNTYMRDFIFFDDYNCWLSRPINYEEWHYAEMLKAISDDKNDAVVAVMPNSAIFNDETLRFYALSNRMNLTILSCLSKTHCLGLSDYTIATKNVLMRHTDVPSMVRTVDLYRDFAKRDFELFLAYNVTTDDEDHRCGFKMNEEVRVYKKRR